MSEGTVHRIDSVLRLSIEQGTLSTPEPARFYVLVDGKVRESCFSLSIANIAFEDVRDEILNASPVLARRRNIVQRERQFREFVQVRAASAAVGKAKATAKGGKGGRSGV